MMVKSLPDIIVASVQKAYPKGEIEEADKITRSDTVEYDVAVEVDDNVFHLRMSFLELC